jgi:hypothetical protein
MKKIFLLASFTAITCTAFAQPGTPATPYVLSGSSYTQDFDSLSALETPLPARLPAGWEVDTAASATSAGGAHIIWKYPSTWKYYGGQFANYASAVTSNFYGGSVTVNDTAITGAQATATNRALGVRQVSPTNTKFGLSDPGAAFTFKIANTTGKTNFGLTFHLQSTDTSSSKICHWTVDYGFGAAPTTFTPASTITGFTNTGNHKFFDTLVTVGFGAGLDNNAGPVWVRVVCLTASDSGACWPGAFCNRATTQIDNYGLTWTNSPGSVATVNQSSVLDLAVLGNATANNMTLSYNTEKAGTYKLAIYDLTGRQVYTQFVTLHTGNDNITIDGLNLNSGLYIVKLGNETTNSVAKAIIE